jgi:hypothetical protein
MALTLTKVYDFANDPDVGIDGSDYRKLAGESNDILNGYINTALQGLGGAEAKYTARGTLDTDADGDILIDASATFSAIDDYELAKINPTSAGVSYQVEEMFDFVTITGDITTASLVLGETLTEGTSGATMKLYYASSLDVGTDVTVVGRILSGTANGDKVWSGAAGEITATAVPATETRWMGGRVFTTSTGASYDSQSGVAFKATVTGTPV